MKHTKLMSRLCLLAALLLLLSALTACGASNEYDAGGAAEMPASSADGMDSAYYSKYSEGKEYAAEDKSVAEDAAQYERKVIRTVEMSCETQDYDGATQLLTAVLAKYNGYVETESVRGTGYDTGTRIDARTATYTFRVPAADLDAFLAELGANEGIRITRQSIGSQEITSQYYDLTSRMETLESEKAALSAMLAGFTDYSDIGAMLEVQGRLYDVIEEIEAVKTQLNLYDGKVAMSTVNLTLAEVVNYSVAAPTFGERMGDAFTESWSDFFAGWLDFFVWLVEAFPTLLVLGGIGVGIYFTVRGIVRSGRKKRAARRAAAMQNAAPNQMPRQ